MSEQKQRQQAETAVDRFLSESGFPQPEDVRDELLELRSLAAAQPPSDAVRALMAGGASTAGPTTAVTTVLPQVKDELAARRRKRRAAIAGLAVAVALGGGATAAAAQEGGIPATFQHLGAAVGSVVSNFAPGPAHAPHEQSSVPAQSPGHVVGPAPSAPKSTDGAGESKPAAGTTTEKADPAKSVKSPAGGLQQPSKAPGNPGNVPAPEITAPVLGTPDLPSGLGSSTIPVPVPTHLVPEVPKTPGNPAK